MKENVGYSLIHYIMLISMQNWQCNIGQDRYGNMAVWIRQVTNLQYTNLSQLSFIWIITYSSAAYYAIIIPDARGRLSIYLYVTTLRQWIRALWTRGGTTFQILARHATVDRILLILMFLNSRIIMNFKIPENLIIFIIFIYFIYFYILCFILHKNKQLNKYKYDS